ncbi:TNT domain-containing protein [Kutzneria sp. NPDC052558]|uniref:TNT domain-containing protein n=1 Tax=Kutzneria sp. NPDC052558 TaxID=3364121 RepID=UPI0037CB1915
MSKIHTNPEHLRRSGAKLGTFGGKLADGGQKLESAGQRLVSHASGDRSGLGSVISKALGKGVQTTGKVFNEGGRVAEGAGKRLHTTADLHEQADEHGAGLLKKLHPDTKGDIGPKGRGNPRSRTTTSTPKGHDSRAEQQRRLREQFGEPKPDSDWISGPNAPVDVHPGLKPGAEKYDAIVSGRRPLQGAELDQFNAKWSEGRDPHSGFEQYRYPTAEHGHPEGFQSPDDKHAEWVPSGTRLDRFGAERGKFLAPEGAPWEARALPPFTLDAPYHSYEVARPFPAWVGPAAGWFDQAGGGTQYYLGQYSVKDLLEKGYLREATGDD